jgi:hypothetical protein
MNVEGVFVLILFLMVVAEILLFTWLKSEFEKQQHDREEREREEEGITRNGEEVSRGGLS